MEFWNKPRLSTLNTQEIHHFLSFTSPMVRMSSSVPASLVRALSVARAVPPPACPALGASRSKTGFFCYPRALSLSASLSLSAIIVPSATRSSQSTSWRVGVRKSPTRLTGVFIGVSRKAIREIMALEANVHLAERGDSGAQGRNRTTERCDFSTAPPRRTELSFFRL